MMETNPKILLADNSEEFRLLLRRTLEETGSSTKGIELRFAVSERPNCQLWAVPPKMAVYLL